MRGLVASSVVALAALAALGGCEVRDEARLHLAVDAAGLLKEIASLELVVYDDAASCERSTGVVTSGDAKKLFEKSQASLDTVPITGITIGTRIFSVTAYRDSFQSIVGRGCQTVTLAESTTPIAVSIQLVRVGDAPKRIIFVSERDGPGQSALFVADFDGTNATRISTAPLSGDDYAIATDGLVAFIGLAAARVKLHTVRSDGQGEGQLSPAAGVDVNPVFSADGKHVTFASNASGNFELYRVSITGGTPTNLTNDTVGVDAYPALSASDELVYVREFNNSGTQVTELFTLTNATPKKVFGGPLRRASPVFAGASTVIVVKGQPVGSAAVSQVVAIDISSGAETDLSGSTTSRDRDPAVSPDASTVVFVSDRDGSDDLFVVNVDGSGLRKLTAGRQPSFHPDGARVVYVNEGDIYEIALAGAAPRQLIKNAANESRPRYLP